MSQLTSEIPADVGLSVSELLKDPLRTVTRERQQQLLIASSIVLLLTLSVATVPEASITPDFLGLKIVLANKGELLALTFTLLLYLLVVFAFDAFQDLYGSVLAARVHANILAKRPREFEASLVNWAQSQKEKRKVLRSALRTATTAGDAEFGRRIAQRDEQFRSIAAEIQKDLNDAELWKRWSVCMEERDSLSRQRETQRDEASSQFHAALTNLAEATSDAPDMTPARQARSVLTVFPRVRVLRIIIEVGVPILLSIAAMVSLGYHAA